MENQRAGFRVRPRFILFLILECIYTIVLKAFLSYYEVPRRLHLLILNFAIALLTVTDLISPESPKAWLFRIFHYFCLFVAMLATVVGYRDREVHPEIITLQSMAACSRVVWQYAEWKERRRQ